MNIFRCDLTLCRVFSAALLHYTDTHFASARPEGAEKTVASGTGKISSLQWCGKICAAPAGVRSIMVSANASIPGAYNICIGTALIRC